MRVITLEEHFVSQRFLDTADVDLGGRHALDLSGSEVTDLGALRLKHMDEAGIDVQVLSHVVPTFTPLPRELDTDIARAANQQAHAAVTMHPDRFQAFAALPMTDPQAAVRELDHAVGDLGFRGALINGRAGGVFLDHSTLYPVLERAAQLHVPLYLHPGLPTAALRAEHYAGFGPSVSYALGTAAWGWHAETGLHALRLIAAGVFDRLPDLHIILGHTRPGLPRRDRDQPRRQGETRPRQRRAPARPHGPRLTPPHGPTPAAPGPDRRCHTSMAALPPSNSGPSPPRRSASA
ncbi:amidohydrolase family protein [Streptacidiphilus sp. EB129]|uniref:amidohydrolase family protein n=1 Tax=Streptacidiphilus sp. EB129 TaxID=3156262 RepID=UPI0035198511